MPQKLKYFVSENAEKANTFFLIFSEFFALFGESYLYFPTLVLSIFIPHLFPTTAYGISPNIKE